VPGNALCAAAAAAAAKRFNAALDGWSAVGSLQTEVPSVQGWPSCAVGPVRRARIARLAAGDVRRRVLALVVVVVVQLQRRRRRQGGRVRFVGAAANGGVQTTNWKPRSPPRSAKALCRTIIVPVVVVVGVGLVAAARGARGGRLETSRVRC